MSAFLKRFGMKVPKLPSRNWLIFYSVVTVSVSGAVYDKERQKKIREEYIERVKLFSTSTLPIDKLSRKVTVFIAPPPSDYLDTSLKFWSRYVKPILFYSGLDYDIITEEQQGTIRAHVAEQLRNLRRELKGIKIPDTKPTTTLTDNTVKKTGEQSTEQIEEIEEIVPPVDMRDAMGIFMRIAPPKNIESEDLAKEKLNGITGGVICIGRGAYKEYINGLHEGLLGPLEDPNPPEEETTNNEKSKSDDIAIEKNIEENSHNQIKEDSNDVLNITESEGTFYEKAKEELDNVNSENQVTSNEIKKESETEKEKSENEEGENKEVKVPNAYIKPEDYKDLIIPEELDNLSNTITWKSDNLPIYLHQPLLVIPLNNLIGFLNIPWKIYRFYNKRHMAKDVCDSTSKMVTTDSVRDFDMDRDLQLGIEEEQDWPKHWVTRGKEKGSEWVQELKGDSRILKHLKVLNAKRPDHNDVLNSEEDN